MRKYLSIIIPRYKETERDIFPLISSINNQVGIDKTDIEVIISTDGEGADLLDNNFLKLFDIDIKQTKLDVNKGPGVARQAGLDIAKGEYVMFCDADDILHSVAVLGALMKEAEKTNVDILSSSWLEEQMINGEYIYITHNIENTWMHGKLIRRSFITSNNIRFHDDLRVHEDSYFLAIAAGLTDRYNFLQVTSYVWKWSKDSITRRNNSEYTFNSYSTFIEACCMAYDHLRKLSKLKTDRIVQFIIYNYFTLHRPEWIDHSKDDIRETCEKTFVDNVKRFWDYYINADQNSIIRIYNEERNKNFNNCIESELFTSWLDRLGLVNRKEN